MTSEPVLACVTSEPQQGPAQVRLVSTWDLSPRATPRRHSTMEVDPCSPSHGAVHTGQHSWAGPCPSPLQRPRSHVPGFSVGNSPHPHPQGKRAGRAESHGNRRPSGQFTPLKTTDFTYWLSKPAFSCLNDTKTYSRHASPRTRDGSNLLHKTVEVDFPGAPGVMNPPANAGVRGSSPGWEERPHRLWDN